MAISISKIAIMYSFFLIHGIIKCVKIQLWRIKEGERCIYLCEFDDTLVGGSVVCLVREAGQYNLYKSGPYRMFDPELRVQ